MRSGRYARLYSYETLLQRLPQDLQDTAPALRQFIQEEYAVVGQRHVAWHRHVAPTARPDIGDGVRRGAARARRDHGGASGLAQGHAPEMMACRSTGSRSRWRCGDSENTSSPAASG